MSTQPMDFHCKRFILEAIEELEDYIPMLENQQNLNQTLLSHCVAGLKNQMENYD